MLALKLITFGRGAPEFQGVLGAPRIRDGSGAKGPEGAAFAQNVIDPEFSLLVSSSCPMTVLNMTCGARTSSLSHRLKKIFSFISRLPSTMIALARLSAMRRVFPTVTASGVVSLRSVSRPSEMLKSPPPPPPKSPERLPPKMLPPWLRPRLPVSPRSRLRAGSRGGILFRTRILDGLDYCLKNVAG